MTVAGVVQRFAPDPDAGIAIAEQQPTTAGTPVTPPASGQTQATADIAKPAEPAAVPSAVVSMAAATKADKDKRGEASADKKVEEKKPKTREERAAERKAEREKGLAEAKAKNEKELRIFTSGRLLGDGEVECRRFPEKAAGDFGFATILIGMFLLGAWFVRSGVMTNTAAHLPFFRKLVIYGLPIGIGLGLLSTLIGMSHTPGDRYDGWQIARGLALIGNLPACLGYVGMVVLMLHSKTTLARIRVLAPLGRMALTNYLTQSLVCAIYFLRLCDGPLGHAADAAGVVRAGGLRGADCLQPLVAVEISLRPDGMALARLHLLAHAAISPAIAGAGSRQQRRRDLAVIMPTG